MTWTRPFYGVTHLEVPSPWRVTAAIWDDFTEVGVFCPGLTPLAETVFRAPEYPDHADRAKAWGEARYRALKGDR